MLGLIPKHPMVSITVTDEVVNFDYGDEPISSTFIKYP